MAQLIIDTANLDEIIAARQTGQLVGVTTNPSLVAKQMRSSPGKSLKDLYAAIIDAAGANALISFEVIATDYEGMVAEGRKIHRSYPNAWVKIPVCTSTDDPGTDPHASDGLRAIRALSSEGIQINCTLINRADQGVLAAIAGAYVLSPFTGRVNDLLRENRQLTFAKDEYYPAEGVFVDDEVVQDMHGGAVSGVDMARDLVARIRNCGLSSKVLAASIRNPREAYECARLAGVDYITAPAKVFMECASHPELLVSRPAGSNDLMDCPPTWEEMLAANNDKLVRGWLYHPKTVAGMQGFLADAKTCETEYRELFK